MDAISIFRDRQQAAEILAEKLIKYKGEDGIVLAIPRGGIPVGYVIAKKLEFPLEPILSKKIGHPQQPELAIGSVTPDDRIIDKHFTVSRNYIEDETVRISELLKQRLKTYMGDRKPTQLKNKTVIITDDGIATGNTILLCIQYIKKQNPAKIIVAVPVAPQAIEATISEIADEYICLLSPENFYAIGEFYENFAQIDDSEVVKLLNDKTLLFAAKT